MKEEVEEGEEREVEKGNDDWRQKTDGQQQQHWRKWHRQSVRPSEIDREARRAGVSPNREGKRRRRRMIGASKLAMLVVCFQLREQHWKERGLKAAGKSFS